MGHGYFSEHTHAWKQKSIGWTAFIVFGMCCSLIFVLLVTSGYLRKANDYRLAQVVDNSIDADYLQAESSGDGGKNFVKRLQEMWFVAQYR